MFNQYPYLNLNDLNLDFLLSEIKTMYSEVTNFVSINAIKYADPIQWNITKQYEKNTVVIDPLTGTAYISVAPVPSGVALTREEYWTVVFDLGSFVTRAAQNFTSRCESDTTLTATFPTNTGEWLVWGDVLYKAISNIVAGDQYVVGSNIEHFTIEDLYNAYLNTIAQILNKIGNLDDLTTSDKTNLVAAINEVADQVLGKIGDLDDLTTSDKTNLVAAINELSEADKNLNLYNVRDYGAKGDGVTDDTAAFKGLMQIIPSGATFYIPSGNYLIGDTIDVANYISIKGDNATISATADNISIFRFDLDAHVFFYQDYSGIMLDGNSHTGVNGFEIYGLSATHTLNFESNNIHNCVFYRLANGIRIYRQCAANYEINVNWNQFYGLQFRICTNGINFTSGSGTGNVITNCSFLCSSYGIKYQDSAIANGNIGDIIINSCHFGDANVGILLDGATNSPSYRHRAVVTNCQFDAGVTKGVRAVSFRYLQMHNNSFGGDTDNELYGCTLSSTEYPNSGESKLTRNMGTLTATSLHLIGSFSVNNTDFIGAVIGEVMIGADVTGYGARTAYLKYAFDSVHSTVSHIDDYNNDGTDGIEIVVSKESATQVSIYARFPAEAKRVFAYAKIIGDCGVLRTHQG